MGICYFRTLRYNNKLWNVNYTSIVLLSSSFLWILTAMAGFQLQPNSKVLLLWSSNCDPEDVKKYAEDLGKDHQLQLENMERLQMGKTMDNCRAY